MSSPEVWDDALARVQALGAAQNVRVVEVGVPDGSDDTAMYLAIETTANSADRIEITGQVWEEEGQVWVHVTMPSSTSQRPGIVLRKAVADVFRFADGMPPGLVYLGWSAPPPDAGSTTGNWYRLSLAVDYRYQDATTASA